MPAIMMMPDSGVPDSVTGNSSDIAEIGPMPGKTPTSVPMKTPMKQYSRLIGSRTISGIDDSRNPNVSSAKEKAMRQAMMSSGLVQRTFSQREPKVAPPSVSDATMIEAANRHIRMP